MKKFLAILMAVMCVCTMGVAAETTQPTTSGTSGTTQVKYTVDSGYEWEIHTDIIFNGTGLAAQSSIAAKLADNTENGVKVTKNVIPDGKNLNITVTSENAWKVKNGSTLRPYTAKLVVDSTESQNALANGGTVLTVAAGTNTGAVGINFQLQAMTGTSEVAGDYLDTLTYTASID